ncbi:MAG: tetratricopeptide repeat protein [Gemmatimonadales bacterium]|nr:tetratricopeptide repeat protein [Gemmatimonadales bacterium]
MRKQVNNPRSERQLKFAEAGVLFVLILGIVLFVGTKVATRSSDQEPALASAQDSAAELISSGENFDPVAEEIVVEPSSVVEPLEATEAAAGIEDSIEDSSPKQPRVVTYDLSEQKYLAGDFEEAADLFALYTEQHPGNAWGHYMEGLSNWKAGDPEVSEKAFIAALEIKPDHLKALVNYGRILLEMDRADEARIQLEAALEIDPLSVDANRVLGRAYHNLGLQEEAAASYRAALAIKIDDVWSLNNLGLILIEQERFEDALPPLAKAVQLNQNIACIQNNLGVALERSGYIQGSTLAFERALAADQQYAKAEKSLERIKAMEVAADGPVRNLNLDLIAASFTTDQVRPVDSTGSLEVASGDNAEQ